MHRITFFKPEFILSIKSEANGYVGKWNEAITQSTMGQIERIEYVLEI